MCRNLGFVLLVTEARERPARDLGGASRQQVGMTIDTEKPGTGQGSALEGIQADLYALVARDRAIVLKVALGYLSNRTEAEDVAQDVFVKAYQQLQRGLPVAALTRAWVLRVAANSAIDRRRSAWWRHAASAATLARIGDRPSHDPSPEDQAVAAADRDSVLSAVRCLPPPLRQVVLLYYFGEQDVASIAEALGVRRGAVKARLFRARERLRPLLERQGLAHGGPLSPGFPNESARGGTPHD